ncbi:MAG: TonB-dependent receptor domain-containing protein [Candidatus Baltobacteraceae bacterium]
MHSFVLALCCLVTGNVHAQSGAPLSSAHVVLHGAIAHDATTDGFGNFAIRAAPGTYSLEASAGGYAPVTVSLSLDHDTKIDVALESTDSRQLRPIGEVTVDGLLVASRSTIPSSVIARRQMEDAGNDRIIDALPEVPSVTLPRPDGGAATAPAVVALRGPDPSETLVTLDGQILNDGNTGDLDLSRFPVAAFSAVNITEGLGPRDLNGSNTIGGGVNILSLAPTRTSHNAFSLSSGSFGASEGWYNATGTHGRLGYAVALDDQQEEGYVNQDATLCVTNPCTSGVVRTTAPIHLGSTISSRSALANLTWNISQSADIGFRAFVLGNRRDESGVLNAPDPGDEPKGGFVGPGTATFSQTIRAYDLHGRAPLGAGSLSGDFSLSNNNTDLAGAGTSPYDVSHQDKRTTASVAWGRSFDDSQFSLGGFVRNESLTEDNVGGAQAQSISSYFARGELHSNSRLRLSGAVYISSYSSFGTSIDGRFGATYDLDQLSTVRFSVGTGFRAPLLIERYVFAAAALPPPNTDCVITGQGNPNEKPEHATEYELGYGKKLSNVSSLDVSVYRTNLRDPIENYYPGPSCPGVAYSYPVNIGNVVYEGGALKFVQRFDKVTVSAQYGVNIAYPYNLPRSISNPTSGGYLVGGEQFLGIPQQVGSLGFDYESEKWHAGLDAIYRGRNNELNQAPYVLINGGIGRQLGKADITLAASNIGSDVAGKFTGLGQGVAYRGNTRLGIAPVATDRFFIEPMNVRLIVTFRN